MEDLTENPPLFETIVKLLEEGKNDEVVTILQTTETKIIKVIVKAADKRVKSEIAIYWYRYRPQYREGFTLLHYAMIYGNPKVVKELVKYGAEPKEKSITISEGKKRVNFNVIHYPCFLGKFENLKALLKESNLSSGIVSHLVNDPYGHVFEDGQEDTWIWTPLHYACGGNNMKILKFLLQLGASKDTLWQ